jgi:hypothetical protein
MTELNLETVVLNGVLVACDNVTGLRMASKKAGQRASEVVLSCKRLPTSQDPESDVGLRYDAPYGGRTAARAGRLLDLAGAPDSRSPGNSGRSLSSRRTLPATTLPTVLWRTRPFTARDARHPGNVGGHPILQPRFGAKRKPLRRIASPGLTRIGPDAMQMQEGMQAKATLRGR